MPRAFQRPRLPKYGGGMYPDWYIEWHDESGRKHWEKVGPTKRAAERLLAQRVAEVVERRRHPGRQAGDGTQLFAELVDEYERVVAPRLRKPRERVAQLRAWQRHFGDRARLTDIRRSSIEAFIAARLEAGLRPATPNRDLAALKAVLSTAVEWGRIPYNIAAPVKKLEEENEGLRRPLTPAETDRLVLAAREARNPAIAVLVQTALNTGGRLGELLALQWEDVDGHRRLVTFRRTKAKRARSVPIEPWLLAELESLRGSAAWVFTTLDGRRLENVRTTWDAVRKRAGLPDAVFHALRHTFATRLVEKGVNLRVVQRLTGHSSLAMVQRYTHPTEESLREAVASLDIGRPAPRGPEETLARERRQQRGSKALRAARHVRPQLTESADSSPA